MKHLRILVCIADVAHSGSIRKSAQRLGLTPSALTRKIQDFEEELGTPLFDRTAQGMRVNAAGELFVQYARNQAADLDRVRAQIADLSGLRRGHVALVCSQVFVNTVVPGEVGAFRKRFPNVTFQVEVRDHAQATEALLSYDAELALILQPPLIPELEILFAVEQPVCAIMDLGHPLAGSGPVRLGECLRFPIAMPDRSLSVRHVLDAAITRFGLNFTIAVESGSIEFLRNYVRREHLVSFQIPTCIPVERSRVAIREIDRRDLAPLQVVLSQLRGRKLSLPAAKFVDQISSSFFKQSGSVVTGRRDRRSDVGDAESQ